MKHLYILILVLWVSVTNAQTDRQFWFVAPAITASHAGETPIYFRVTAGALGANITISMPANVALFNGGVPITQNIPANTTISINMSPFVAQIENNYDFLGGVAGKSNKGIYIESDNPVTIYYEDGMTNNCDIFALKGKNGLGTEFYTVFQNKGYNMSKYDPLNLTDANLTWTEPATSAIDIVATVDGTIVTIESPLASQDLYFYRTGNFSINLNKGETFSIPPYWNTNVPTASVLPTCNLTKYANDLFGRAGADHLGGLRITSNANHPIAITKKDDSVRYYCVDGWGGGCYDLIGDQMVPLDILGKEYIAMRGGLTTAPENVYCVATADATSIYINGNAVPVTTINRGQTYVYELWNSVNNSVHIRGSNKLSVLHVSGFGCEVGGAILPPIDKCTGSTKVSVTRSTGPPLLPNESFFFNLMVWDGAEDGFIINGVVQDGSPGTLFDPSDFAVVPGTSNWKIWRSPDLRLNANFPTGGTFTFENTKDVFHLGLINGGSSSGCRFGYFSDFNELRVEAQATGSLSSSIRACSYESIQLYAQGGTDYRWWPTQYLDNPTSPTPISNPPADTIMIFFAEVSGACGLTDTATVSVEKFPELESQFSIDKGFGCSPLLLTIHEISSQVRERFWDFNFTNINGSFDRDTIIYGGVLNYDTDTTFTHLFTNTSNEPTDTIQNYSIRLLSKNTNDCSDTAWASVSVYPEVHAIFSITVPADTIGCSPHSVLFVNSSINENAYAWLFGDGTSSNIANPPKTFTNILNNTVTYNTRLVTRSNYFCRDTAYLKFRIRPYIENGFTINKHNGCSPLDVTITNNSAFADTIFIDFGDGKDTIMTSFASFVHRYKNVSSNVDTNIIEMIVKNDEGCYEFAYDTVIVYPEIRANYTLLPNQYTGCNSQSFQFNNMSNDSTHTASSYLWTFGDGSTSNLASPTKVYNNTTSANKPYTFNLRAQSIYGCFDDTSRIITIYRALADFNLDTASGCSPLTVNITNTSVGNDITAWAWDFGQVPNSSAKDPLTKTYTNTLGVTINPNLRLTVTGTGGCSTFKEVPINVYSSVDISFTPDLPVVCDSAQIPFNTILSHGAVASYNWTFGDGTSSGVMNPVKTYRNLLSPTDTTYTAKLKALTAQGCADSMSTVVTVRPYVNALFTIDSVSGCTPLTVNPVATTYMGIPAANYLWTLNGALIHTGFDPSPYLLPVNPAPGPEANYKLRLSVSNLGGYCPDFMEKDIDVYPAALANFTPKEVSGCNSFVVDFLSTSSTNSTSFLWDFGDLTTFYGDNPLPKSFSNADDNTKTYKIKLKATTDYGCTHTDSANIYVHPFVKADFAVDISKDCSPLEVTITNNSRGGTYRWYWDSQTGTGPYDTTTTTDSGVFKHKYINTTAGDKTFYLTVVAENDSACTKLFTRSILVHSSIVAGFTYSQPDSCNQSDVRFTNTSTGGNSYTMNWNFGDGTSLATTISPVDHKFINNTIYDVPYTVVMSAESENGCKDSFTDTVRVYSRVEANFSIPISRGCPNAVTTNFDANIVNTSIGNGANTYQWYIDNTAIATAPTNKNDFYYSYQNNLPAVRKYGVKLRATNPHRCFSEKSDTVTVYEYVDANFVAVNPAGCSPLTVNFTNSSSAPLTNTNYLWEYGDNTSSQSFAPPHAFVNESRTTDRPFRILLTVTSENYCKDTISRGIMVYHQPLAKLYVSETSDCPPLVGTMNNNNSRGYSLYKWDYGDGSPVVTVNSTTPETRTYSYPNPSIDVIYNYWVKLYVESNQGCWHRDSSKLVVFPDVIADFTYDLAGCSPFVAEFKNTSSTPATRFLWDFKDGSTDNNATVLHRFVNDTELDVTLNVSLTATSDYDCWDIISKPVTIYAQPKAFYNPLPSVQIFPENRVHLNSTSNNKPWNYLWTFDDGLTSTDANVIFHDYEHWGERNINLRLQSSTSPCFDTLTKKIVIYPPAINAAFTTNVSEGCLNTGFEVDFTAYASAYSEVYTYEWEFGDGSATQYGQNISHTYTKAGVYYVKLTASGESGEDYEYKTIRVYSNPKANFEVSPKVVMLNTDLEARVEFFNLSECNDTSGCSYLWDFGNGKTSIARDVTHNYTPTPDEVPIKYDISLYVTTAHGCRDSLILIEEVEIIGAGQIEFPNAFTPNGDGLNDTFRPVSEGVIQYDLLLYNRWGELIFKTNDLSVGWNGTIKGNDAKPDVYVWKAQGKFSNGRAFEMAGDVTLIR